jgi:hypothetical protein
MLFQMTELEYDLIDQLADGPASVMLLLRSAEGRQHPWELGMLVTSLLGMLERQLVRCCRVPGSAAFAMPSREALLAEPSRVAGSIEGGYWFELTERGQAVWEMWLQAKRLGNV